MQSAICIDDIPLENAYITVRDGVSIDEYTGVAKDKAKYDYEVVERGARGTFTMTWQLRQKVVEDLPKWKVFLDDLVKQLAYGIRIGAMTAKGFGYVRLEKAKIHLYDFSQYDDVKAWLSRKVPKTVYDVKAEERLGNQSFVIEADFALKTSLLVRSRDVSAADSEQNIDVVPMMSGNDYLIPGPSVKGVLRHQAAHILRVLGKSPDLLDGLMGYSRDDGKSRRAASSSTKSIFHRTTWQRSNRRATPSTALRAVPWTASSLPKSPYGKKIRPVPSSPFAWLLKTAKIGKPDWPYSS